MTDLDKKLQEMAVMNWPQFAKLLGDDALTAAKICLLRQQNKSYGEISVKLNVTEKKARYWSGECCSTSQQAKQ